MSMRAVLYGPPNWLVEKFSSEDRRMFGFWTIVLATVGAMFFGREVLYVTVLSILALIPNFAAETPVEEEPAAVREQPDGDEGERIDALYAAQRQAREQEPWWIVRYKDGGHEAVQAESRTMARFEVETREGGTGHNCGHPDHIGWIEGPFTSDPSPFVREQEA